MVHENAVQKDFLSRALVTPLVGGGEPFVQCGRSIMITVKLFLIWNSSSGDVVQRKSLIRKHRWTEEVVIIAHLEPSAQVS